VALVDLLARINAISNPVLRATATGAYTYARGSTEALSILDGLLLSSASTPGGTAIFYSVSKYVQRFFQANKYILKGRSYQIASLFERLMPTRSLRNNSKRPPWRSQKMRPALFLGATAVCLPILSTQISANSHVKVALVKVIGEQAIRNACALISCKNEAGPFYVADPSVAPFGYVIRDQSPAACDATGHCDTYFGSHATEGSPLVVKIGSVIRVGIINSDVPSKYYSYLYVNTNCGSQLGLYFEGQYLWSQRFHVPQNLSQSEIALMSRSRVCG